MQSKSFRLYDWGKKTNQEKYGQGTPPDIDLTKITNVPTAMFVGTEDDLGDVTDCHWARDQIQKGGDALVHYQEVDAGHSTFLIAKDMSYFNDVMDLVHTYNPLSEKFLEW